jgi:diguanylate cyclase (GGDEF)-like protein
MGLLGRFCGGIVLLVLLHVANAAEVHPVAAHPARELIERAEIAARTDPEASRRDAEDALRLLVQKPDADLEIRARLLLCDYQSERDTAAAEQQIGAATALLPKATRLGLRAGILTCQGEIAETASENGKATALYEQAVSVATETHDNEMLASALFSRGYLLGLQGLYASGLSDLKRAQTLFTDLGMPHHALTTLNSIAIQYNRMGDYAQARDMYSAALKAQRENGMLREEGVTLHNLGRAYENLREWAAARQAFDQSLQISRQLNYPRSEAYALRGLAAVENGLGNPQTALEILDRASLLQKQTPDARLNAQIQLARGDSLYQLKRLPESVQALQEALQVFRQADSLSELRATYLQLADGYRTMGDWRAAYGHLTKAQETAERQFRNQIDQRFATLKVEFDTASKEKENALLTRENEANEKALVQERKAGSLQAAVIALTAILALLLAALALHQRRTTLRMRLLAMTDELTGVPNRRAVLSQLEPLLRRTDAEPCAMLIIDIDHFKSINDQHGHVEGDEALKLVASELRSAVRDPAFLGRLGGEEFVVVLPGTSVEGASVIAERIREEVMRIDSRRWLLDRKITVSIGVTVSVPQVDSPSTMLRRADTALYAAKRAGRNQVKVTMPAAVAPSSGPAQASDSESIGFA